MNKEQESLIASGLWLLIKNSNEIEDNEKLTWMNDFDKLFGEKELKNEPCCEMPEEEMERTCSIGHSKEFTCPECKDFSFVSNLEKKK